MTGPVQSELDQLGSMPSWFGGTPGDWTPAYESLADSEPERGEQIHAKRTVETPVFSRAPIRKRIDYELDYGQFPTKPPTVPMPVRSSFAQLVLIWKQQWSHYISGLRRGSPEQLLRYGIDHPTAHALHRFPISPVGYTQMSPHPRPVLARRFSGKSGVARQGAMGAPQRFPKALPVFQYSYNPPVYGQNE